MRPTLILSLLLLVALPLAGLAWLGARMVGGERAKLRESFQQVMEQRLADVNEQIARAIAEEERQLIAALNPPDLDPNTLRDIPRQARLIQQVFVIDARGRRQFPSANASLQSAEEVAFLTRSEPVWKNGVNLDFHHNEKGPAADQGWHSWYHGTGSRYLFWKRLPDGKVLGAEVPPSVLLADVMAHLPPTNDAIPVPSDATFVMIDSEGRALYQWGSLPENRSGVLTVKAPVVTPLGGWSLILTAMDVVSVNSGSWRSNLFLGLAAAGVVLGLIAFHLYRESTREIKLAGQRVSFVNQVSHELKTPLTNISLYAELATERLPEHSESAKECLDVVTSESARLGRLIGNVLTFSKHQHGRLQPRVAKVDISCAIQSTVDQFRPSLKDKGVEISLELQPNLSTQTDADMLGQIVGNLLSNVEKYAAGGKAVRIVSESKNKQIQISVMDQGPGIPKAMCERIFEPFFRLSDKLSDGTTGTGIGLGISRELARLLGGELVTVCSPPTGGSHFLLTIPLS